MVAPRDIHQEAAQAMRALDAECVAAGVDQPTRPETRQTSDFTLDTAPDSLLGLDRWLHHLTPAQFDSSWVASIVHAVSIDAGIPENSVSLRALASALLVAKARMAGGDSAAHVRSEHAPEPQDAPGVSFVFLGRGGRRGRVRPSDAELQDRLVQMVEAHGPDGLTLSRRYNANTRRLMIELARRDPRLEVVEVRAGRRGHARRIRRAKA